jgi:hypothetical protein
MQCQRCGGMFHDLDLYFGHLEAENKKLEDKKE